MERKRTFAISGEKVASAVIDTLLVSVTAVLLVMVISSQLQEEGEGTNKKVVCRESCRVGQIENQLRRHVRRLTRRTLVPEIRS